MTIQNFGEKFELEKLLMAREVARDMVYELSSLIRPGMTEDDATMIYKKLCQKYPVEKNWHPPKIRFGPNTLANFRDLSAPYVLQEEDIFFLDIGPVINGHEADFGATFTVGGNLEHQLMASVAERLFYEVSDHWRQSRAQGKELYEWASRRAEDLGYRLNWASDGHRISDFPHQIFFKGGIPETHEDLLPHAWVLEIHLAHPSEQFGSFFEDILS
jgi:Xaa-Pro aminopeptidase